MLLAFLIGIVAGARSLLAPAAITLAAHFHGVDLAGTWMVGLSRASVHFVLVTLSLAELVADKQQWIPSRKDPMPFAARVISGAVCGAAVGTAGGVMLPGMAAGALGAVTGTLGGHALRASLARSFGRDLPAALLEDALAVALAAVVVLALMP